MSYDTIVSIQKFQVISNSSSSVIQAGESEHVSLYHQGISVERDITNSIGNMPMFGQYSLFSEALPDLTPLFPYEQIVQNELPVVDPLIIRHAEPSITVGRLNVISSSSSSYIHAGNSHTLMTDSRSKTIFHFTFDKQMNTAKKNKGSSKMS